MSDDLIRIGAVVAAVAVLAFPYAGKLLEHARKLFAVREPQTPDGIGIDDMTTLTLHQGDRRLVVERQPLRQHPAMTSQQITMRRVTHQRAPPRGFRANCSSSMPRSTSRPFHAGPPMASRSGNRRMSRVMAIVPSRRASDAPRQ